jgi:hypothetical protein
MIDMAVTLQTSSLKRLTTSLLKSKSRLEGNNAALRYQLTVLQRNGARSRRVHAQ